MKKLVFISSITSPYQVKFCYALQRYFDARFWFYEQLDKTRADWWKMDLGDKCEVLKNVLFIKSTRYLCLGLWSKLDEFSPDIVVLGGFSIPGNYLGYLWARKNRRKTVVFTERSRDASGRPRNLFPFWTILRFLYRDVDMVMTSADDIVPQFRDEFGFGEKVVPGRYAADLDAYFSHPVRTKKDSYTYLFANRMTDIYNPLGAIEIFSEILKKYPGSHLLMNATGELKNDCRALITKLGIESHVEFLENIPSWDEMHKVYLRSDILLLPARFSNGNFTILEAMASGMGVVISDQVLGIGKLVRDGENGFNCRPSPQAFSERIEQYVQRPELFGIHAGINRPLVKPMSLDGTAKFFSGIIGDRSWT